MLRITEEYLEYLEWCESIVTKIYYAENNEALRKAVAEIADRLHESEYLFDGDE